MRKAFGAMISMATTVASSAFAEPAMAQAPPETRLTFGRVFADAAPEVQVAFLILVMSAGLSLAIWATNISKSDDPKRVATALGRLRIVRSAATPLGCLAASYTLFSGFVGMANVTPAPAITILAPGWAEAALAVMLGLLTTTVAVTCERHLEARVRRAAA